MLNRIEAKPSSTNKPPPPSLRGDSGGQAGRADHRQATSEPEKKIILTIIDLVIQGAAKMPHKRRPASMNPWKSQKEQQNEHDTEMSQVLHEIIHWLWSNYSPTRGNYTLKLAVAVLEAVAGEMPRNLQLRNKVFTAINNFHLEQESYQYSDTYPRLLRQSCNGVTERGLRCSRTTTITYGRNGMGFCKQHLDHVPAVYQTFIKAMESVGEEAIQRVSWTRALAESSNAGCVYFAWDGGQNLKIGYTSGAAENRIDDIRRDRGRQTRAPSGVDWANLKVICEIQGTVKTEKTIHKNLWRHSTEGEWFTVSADLVRSLEGVGIDLGREISDYLRIDYRHVWDSKYDYTEDAESALDVDTADAADAEWVPVSAIRPKQLTKA